MKKETKSDYFDLLKEQSEIFVKSAYLLRNMIADYGFSDIAQAVNEIKELEVQCRKSTEKISSQLLKEFLPPIDREDILHLSHCFGRIIKYIKEAVFIVAVFGQSGIMYKQRELSTVLNDCTKALCEAVGCLKGFKENQRLQEKLLKTVSLSMEADDAFFRASKSFYGETNDMRKLAGFMYIAENIKKSCDACRETAHDIEIVVMKNI